MPLPRRWTSATPLAHRRVRRRGTSLPAGRRRRGRKLLQHLIEELEERLSLHSGGKPKRLSRSKTSTGCTCIGVAVSSTSPCVLSLSARINRNRAFGPLSPRRPGPPAPGVVCLIEDHKVIWFGGVCRFRAAGRRDVPNDWTRRCGSRGVRCRARRHVRADR